MAKTRTNIYKFDFQENEHVGGIHFLYEQSRTKICIDAAAKCNSEINTYLITHFEN